MLRHHNAFLLALAILATTFGCSSTPDHSSSPTSAEDSPAWIDNPNGVYDEGNSKVIYAVGIAADNPNPAARRNQALARGRAELARTISTRVQAMVVDYMQTNRDLYDMDAASSQEYFEDISRQVSDETLVGSQQVRAWRDPADGTYYVQMRLAFDDVILEYKSQMDQAYAREAQRQRIKANAEEFETKLDEQLDKLAEMDAERLNAMFPGGDS